MRSRSDAEQSREPETIDLSLTETSFAPDAPVPPTAPSSARGPSIREEPKLPETPPLGMRTKLWYGSGQIAEGAKNHAFSAFLLFYYTQTLGLSGTLAGTAIFIALLFDAVTDPLVGVLSDRLRSPWGRRHPFMYAAALPMAITFYLVFSPVEGLGETGLFLWLTTFAILTRGAMTLYHVPHMSLGAELSDDYEERTQIVQMRSISGVLGGAVCGGVAMLYFFAPTPEFENGQLNPEVYSPFAAIFSVVICVSILASALGTHSRIRYLGDPDHASQQGGVFSSVVRDLREILTLRSFRALFFGTTFAFIAFGVSGNLGLFVATYFWQVTMQQMLIGGFFSAFGIFSGLAIWPVIAARIDKKPTFLLGFVIFTIFAAVPYLLKVSGMYPAHDSAAYLPLYYVIHLIWSFGISATMVTGGSMMADLTDQDQLVHRRRREGIFFGASSFSAKSFVGLGGLIAGMVVDFVGLKTGMKPSEITPRMHDDLGLATGLSLLVLVSIGIALFSRYSLDREQYHQIRAELDARSESSPDSA